MNKIVQEISERYHQIKEGNSKYSLRAFAKKLDLKPGELSEILNHKRQISLQKAHNIIGRLYDSPTDRILSQKRMFSERRTESQKVEENQFELIQDPIHFALLSLMRSATFRSDVDWMSQRLGTNKFVVGQALKRLEVLGLVELQERNYVRTSRAVHTSDDIRSQAIQASHLKDLETAKQKLKDVPVALRDFSSMTILVNPSKLKEIKELIRKFQDDLDELCDENESQEVYKLATQFYPLTQPLHLDH